MQTGDNEQASGRRGGKAFLAASVAAQFCALARYTLLARLLGPEQLGLAVVLILTAQFFEAVTDSGSDRFLVQDPQGDEPEVQRLAHLVWLCRGLFIAATLVVLAAPLAYFYERPELQSGLVILALAPLIAGFTHLDFRRAQRRSDFTAESRSLLASELASLIVTGVAAALLRDYTAILYGLITRSLVLAATTHLTAERRYRIGFAADHAGRLGRFAWPLMLNGLLLFVGSQGDRVLIGREIGITELGYYSAALLLIYYPTGILQRYVSTMHLPLIARAKHDPRAFAAAADRLGGQVLLLSIVMAAGFAAVAPFAIVLLYGERFAQPALVVAAIGILQTSRFIRLWPVTTALALGQSRIVLASNLVRLSAFPLALGAIAGGWGLTGVVGAFTIGECLSLLATMAIVHRQSGRPIRSGLARVLLYLLACLLILGWAAAAEQGALIAAAALAIPTLLMTYLLLRWERQTIAEASDLIFKRSAV